MQCIVHKLSFRYHYMTTCLKVYNTYRWHLLYLLFHTPIFQVIAERKCILYDVISILHWALVPCRIAIYLLYAHVERDEENEEKRWYIMWQVAWWPLKLLRNFHPCHTNILPTRPRYKKGSHSQWILHCARYLNGNVRKCGTWNFVRCSFCISALR